MSRYRHTLKTAQDKTSRALRPLLRTGKSITLWAGDRVLPIVIALTLSGAGIGVYANLDSPAPPSDPSAQSYSMQDLCDRLETGTEGTLAETFAEPPTSPANTPSMCSANDIYELTPQPDETNAAQISDVEGGKTFWALDPSGGWGQTTAAATAILAATGQNTCYDAGGSVIACSGTGQDGEYQLGDTASPRFTDNADGTVTDNLTGLIWLQNADCFGQRIWETALTDANSLASGSCGLTDGSVAGDWRLPNVNELASLIDYQTAAAPRIPTGHPFSSVQSNYYWSSTSYRPTLSHAWNVNFSDGTTSNFSKTLSLYVWPVR